MNDSVILDEIIKTLKRNIVVGGQSEEIINHQLEMLLEIIKARGKHDTP